MANASNVFALPNASVPNDEPIAEIVEILEDALAAAKSGKTIGVAIVTVERDPLANTFVYHTPKLEKIGYHAAHSSRHTLMAGVMGLTWKLGQHAADESDDE